MRNRIFFITGALIIGIIVCNTLLSDTHKERDEYRRLVKLYYLNGSLGSETNKMLVKLGLKHGSVLFENLTYRDGHVSQWIGKYLNKNRDSEFTRHEIALSGFYIMGTNAVIYIPNLVNILYSEHVVDKIDVARCIGAIGPSGRDVLLKALDSDNDSIIIAALHGLIVVDNLSESDINKAYLYAGRGNKDIRIGVSRLIARHGNNNKNAIITLLKNLKDNDKEVVYQTLLSMYSNNIKDISVINEIKSMKESATSDCRLVIDKIIHNIDNNEEVKLIRFK